ncbi:MAG: phospho-N-acetylmuramoyl-pentapeptide-transferase [Actinomycetia bacterium]|nr:phospho-N-acetylmuramoyl-pentapeptide-transferase [Actinomycetes bacterium]MCP5034364.1 phospho-N-acetylmuramoyl-pentapeptide-transferase [Actinomycetes bacterium]
MIRLLLAGAIAFVLSALLTRVLIKVLTTSRIGQPIREDGPQGHMIKAGTPTMGGLAIVAAALGAYGLSDLISDLAGVGSTITNTGLLVMAAIGSAGLVGFLDDWIKVSRERNLGLNARLKTAGLLMVAILFAVLMVRLTGVHTELSFARYGVPGWDLGSIGWVIWAVILIYATSNAVNLTDGLDGLAGGSGIFSFSAYAVIGFWIFRQNSDPTVLVDIYDIPHALDIGVVAVAMLAACAGFLWFNAAPAEIFMGDTGSLAIGTGLAALALVTNTHLLLPVIGGIYVLETASVMAQVAFFKVTRGRRLLRMAPVHHHFELLGWAETKVIIRFWLVAGGLTLAGLALFYADWVATADIRR